MATIIDGKLVSNTIKENIKEEVSKIIEKYGKAPTLAVVLVGSNPASLIYVRNKIKACNKVGINSIQVILDEKVSEEEIKKEIIKLANNPDVNGILVQLPLPNEINKESIIELIPEDKDVDGLTKKNVAKLVLNEGGIIPCTPSGVVDLLKYYNIETSGKRVAIIGRSMLVGKPLSLLLTNLDATVTLCHSKTKNIEEITKNSDIIVCALGKPRFLKDNMVSKNAIIIDVGINRIEDKIVGDADFENIFDKVSYITPVPGGCGPMTVAELLNNTVKCFYIQNKWLTMA